MPSSKGKRPQCLRGSRSIFRFEFMSYWNGKVCVVTGGSAGLGLNIARCFARAGSRVALIARDKSRLQAAVESLHPHAAISVSADVVKADEAAGAIEEIVQQLGQIDVLVNNVGKSCRTALFSVPHEDYLKFLEINLLSAVHCTTAAIGHLEKTSGHVVNIGSLSSKTAWPFLAPYTTSKYALAAYNHHLRLEGPSNVHYMLVCPGPIRRDDAGSRYDDQTTGLPEHARQPAAGVKMRGVDPKVLAEQILRGCEKRKLELIPLRSRLVLVASAWSPRIGDWLLRRKMRN
jgi:uncharacterized protein